MLITKHNLTPLKVLITRPEKKAQRLASALIQQGIACLNQPLFDYQPQANYVSERKRLANSDILIFVSAAAAEFANAYWPAKNWQYQHILAVGKASKKALQQLDQQQVISPEQENSEGLLASPLLNQALAGKKITIVRGNGGREHLATTLTSRGAKVSYFEPYQRVWRILPQDIAKQWFAQQINCIVITSNAILEQLVALLGVESTRETDTITNYWRQSCYWLTVSQRIAAQAKQLGLNKVITCNGASDKAICGALQSLEIDLHNHIQ